MNTIKFFKTHPDAYIPKIATAGSACFDLHASLIRGDEIKCYRFQDPTPSIITPNAMGNITIEPFMRVLVPINLIMDIPSGYSVRIHPRSGITLKQGLTLFNCEGVIDDDYVDPCFVTLYNISGLDQTVCDGDRIAQAELVVRLETKIEETLEKPVQKTERAGGFGSTGKQ